MYTRAFTDFEKWKQAAASAGYRVKLVTRGKTNRYYQATDDSGIRGFFNTGLKGGRLTK